MSIRFSKESLVSLCCRCCQAEQSLGNALSYPKVWSQFLSYYNEAKKKKLEKLISEFKLERIKNESVPGRDSFEQNTMVAIVKAVTYFIINRTKKAWSLSDKEIVFIANAIDRLLGMLGHQQPPMIQDVIDLRMDFSQCGLLIRHKLIGIPEIRMARKIEHFNQSAHFRHLLFDEIEGGNGDSTKSTTASLN